MIALGCDHGGYELKQEIIKYLEEIGWNMDDINNVLFFLVSLNINMIDEGEETDMFFVHF